MLLAGDVGGTKTRLGIFERSGNAIVLRTEQRFESKKFANLAEIIRTFLAGTGARVDSACFGVPGPVIGGTVKLPNLPWEFCEATLREQLTLRKVKLVNDLAATAAAISNFTSSDLRLLHAGTEPRERSVFAVVAPGTGLGQSFLHHSTGSRPLVFPTESGHIDFAPHDETEFALLQHLQKRFKRVSIERVLCGPGLVNIYEFLRDTGRATESSALKERMKVEDPGAAITQAALANSAEIAVQSMDLFVRILGGHIGNVVLTYLATGGVYLGGGIPPKIADRLAQGDFLAACWNKGRFEGVVRSTPINIILDDRAALFGAAALAEHLD